MCMFVTYSTEGGWVGKSTSYERNQSNNELTMHSYIPDAPREFNNGKSGFLDKPLFRNPLNRRNSGSSQKDRLSQNAIR